MQQKICGEKKNCSPQLLSAAKQQTECPEALENISQNCRIPGFPVVSRVKKKTRKNLDPRGIENKLLSHCYWNSVLQNLMHVPFFLHWISSHVRTLDCVDHIEDTLYKKGFEKPQHCARCEMKKLIQDYWGPEDPKTPIQLQNQALCNLKEIAWYITQLDPEGQEDTHELLLFLFNDQHGLFRGHHLWHEQAAAIFQTTIATFYTCNSCSVEREGDPDFHNQLSVRVDENFPSLVEAIGNHFDIEWVEVNCREEGCAGRMAARFPRIRVAPKVLIVHLGIYRYSAWVAGYEKLLHPIGIPEELELKWYHENPKKPLKYRLSGVIAHEGPSIHEGHYVACVRSPGTNPFYQLSDASPRRALSVGEFTSNPQSMEGKKKVSRKNENFMVYMLTYIAVEEVVEKVVKERRMVSELR